MHRLERGWDMEREPYILLRWRAGKAVVTGQRRHRLGHRIRLEDGRSDGVCADWEWNGHRFSAGNDRLGFQPLYYYRRGDELAVSPSIERLLALGAPDGLDESALAVFLRLGFFLGEDTPFTAIRALPPAARLIWQQGRSHLEVQPAPPRPLLELSRDAALDGFIELFRQAVRRRLPEAGTIPTVPLSGGRDSRHILLELVRAGVRPHCVTACELPVSDLDEGAAAMRLSRALGLAHSLIEVRAPVLAVELAKNRATDFCADEHGWYLPVAEHLSSRSALVYDGIGGDVMAAGLFLDAERLGLMRRGETSLLAHNLLGYETSLRNLLTPEAYERLSSERAHSRLEAELERHCEAANPVGSFYLANRTRREIALCPLRLLRTSRCQMPFLDRDVVDFLTALPAELLLDHRFHTDAIARAQPDYADVPYFSGPPGMKVGWHHTLRFCTGLTALSGQRRHGQLLRRSFLLPRIARSILQPGYGAEFIASLGLRAAYLLQLEARGRLGGADGGTRLSPTAAQVPEQAAAAR